MFPELRTQRLLLSEVKQEDQSFVFEGLSHPDIIPYYGVRYETFEAAAAQLDWYNQIYREGTGISWKVVDQQSRCSLGDITIYSYKREHNKAEVGFWFLPQYWGNGFALEALQAVINYWKKEKKLHRLEAFVEEGNVASCRLLDKAGFKHEGKMVDCEIKHGTYISLHIYGLIL